jgi:hypothetical protein
MNRARSLFWFILAAVLVASNSPHASACTACFGKSDSNMAKGMNMGIFALLLVITSVLCGVAGFFVFLAKRNSHLNEPQFAPNLSENSTNA